MTPQSNNNNLAGFTSQDSYRAQNRPSRDNLGTEDCFCTHISQCTESKVIEVANYSSFIDPRVKDTEIEALVTEILKLQAMGKRKKRSPDGDHHHHHHGHHGNIDLTTGHHETQFGPQGPRPPFCGGPGSGLVCCKPGGGVASPEPILTSPDPGLASILAEVDFNELGGGELLRDTRNQNQFSKFQQCGRRNAFNEVKSRIRNENILNNLIDERSDDVYDEADAVFDYDLEIALDKLDIDPAAKEIVRKIRRIRRKKETTKPDPAPSKSATTVDADFGGNEFIYNYNSVWIFLFICS